MSRTLQGDRQCPSHFIKVSVTAGSRARPIHDSPTRPGRRQHLQYRRQFHYETCSTLAEYQ